MQKSTIILESNFNERDNFNNNKLRDLLNTLTNKTSSVERNSDNTICFCVDYDNDDDVIYFLDVIDKCRYEVCDEFPDIHGSDFYLNVCTDSVKVLNHVMKINQNFANNQIQSLDYVVSLQVQEIEEIKNNISSIINFLSRSDVINTVKSYPILLEELYDKQVIDSVYIENGKIDTQH